MFVKYVQKDPQKLAAAGLTGKAQEPGRQKDFEYSTKRWILILASVFDCVAVTRPLLNSAFAFSNPRMLNCLNPSTFLIQPLGGWAIHLRLR